MIAVQGAWRATQRALRTAGNSPRPAHRTSNRRRSKQRRVGLQPRASTARAASERATLAERRRRASRGRRWRPVGPSASGGDRYGGPPSHRETRRPRTDRNGCEGDGRGRGHRYEKDRRWGKRDRTTRTGHVTVEREKKVSESNDCHGYTITERKGWDGTKLKRKRLHPSEKGSGYWQFPCFPAIFMSGTTDGAI